MQIFRRVLIGFFVAIILVFLVLYIWSNGASGLMENSASVSIARPASVVHPWLTETPRVRRWLVGLKQVQLLNADEGSPRARSIEVFEVDGQYTTMTSEAMDLEDGRVLRIRLHSQVMESTGYYQVEEHDGHTTVFYHGSVQFYPFLLRLIAPVVERSAQRQLQGNLEGLKFYAEKE